MRQREVLARGQPCHHPDLPEGDSHWRLEVEDQGIGIKPDDVPRLFVEFHQLDAGMSRRHEGSGLGLAITRQIVEALGAASGCGAKWARAAFSSLSFPG